MEANQTDGNLSSFHKPWNKCVCLPSGETENNIFQISSLNFQTCVTPPNPGGVQLSLFLVYGPPPSPPLPQIAAQLTLHVKRLNAEKLSVCF